MCGFVGQFCLDDTNHIRTQRIKNRGRISSSHQAESLTYYYYRLPTDGVAKEIQNSAESSLLFNGLITNSKDLVERYGLSAAAKSFDSQCLKELFQRGDLEFLSSLRGMFSLVFIDKETIYLVRDTIGIKPLYYVLEDDFFAFASEREGIESQQTQRVMPGEIVVFNTKEFTIKKQSFDYLSETEFQKKDLKQLLIDSVCVPTERYLAQTNKKMACLLSGGLDSSIMAQILCNNISDINKISFYCLTDESVSDGDWKYAKLFAQANNLELNQVRLGSAKKFLDHTEDYIELAQSSSARVIRVAYLLDFLAEAVAKDHIEVLLSGEGADEIFYGYDHFLRDKNPEQSSQAFENFFVCKFSETLLRRLDRVLSHKLIEGRVPFLDQEIVKLGNSLTPQEKIGDYHTTGLSKALLRELARDLGVPEPIIERPKVKMTKGVTGLNNHYQNKEEGYLDRAVRERYGKGIEKIAVDYFEKKNQAW